MNSSTSDDKTAFRTLCHALLRNTGSAEAGIKLRLAGETPMKGLLLRCSAEGSWSNCTFSEEGRRWTTRGMPRKKAFDYAYWTALSNRSLLSSDRFRYHNDLHEIREKLGITETDYPWVKHAWDHRLTQFGIDPARYQPVHAQAEAGDPDLWLLPELDGACAVVATEDGVPRRMEFRYRSAQENYVIWHLTETAAWTGGHGFADTPEQMTVPKGTLLRQHGRRCRNYLYPTDAEYGSLALPAGLKHWGPYYYEVRAPLPVLHGATAPAFGYPGGGQQFVIDHDEIAAQDPEATDGTTFKHWDRYLTKTPDAHAISSATQSPSTTND